MNKYCLLLVLLILPFILGESEYKESEFVVNYEYYKNCNSQMELNMAAYDEYMKADKMLNRIYNDIVVKYKKNPLLVKKIRETQLAWIKFRDLHINSIWPYDLPNNILYWGSMHPEVEAIELAEVTWQRVKQLIKWIQNDFNGPSSYGRYDGNPDYL